MSEIKKIFVLKCGQGKIYVGSSDCKQDIIRKHYFGKTSCYWTKLHEPIGLIRYVDYKSEDQFDEIVQEYKAKVGEGNIWCG